ncbi:hypothetical protein [Humibacter sp. RRB41]|uniref:hypothetical protein n=1 Tax=Humibacter sp. RRB41 TaxID=2919946 RepID=UPI001FA9CE39|nr:hypothetical protein [Humibacter sp. RRB41]
MRFLVAILAFVVAAVLIGAGIAQRTIWIPASNVITATVVKGGAPFTVIDGSVLRARGGQQTLTVSGSAKPFVAYGRTADVLAWLGKEKYAKVTYDAATNTLTSKVVKGKVSTPSGSTTTATPTPTPSASDSKSSTTGSTTTKTGPNPAGSDLWLEEFSGDAASITKMNVPDTVSVIIASDGTKPAPDKVSLNWPLDSSTPLAGPLIVGGIAFGALGILMYILALRHLRRSRGPRRGGGKPPKLPRGSKPPKPGNYPPTQEVEPPARGRRSIGRTFTAVPVVLVGTLLLAGCSSDYWPQFGASETPKATSTPIATDLPGQGKDTPPPAVTSPQLDNIVNEISKTTAKADAKLDATLAATRFSGPALAARTGDYALRAKKSDAAAEQTIPANAVSLALPEATDTWPRVVSAIVHDPKDAKAAPLDLVLIQASPRENYTVEYAIALEANAKVPDLPPANIGTSIVPPDSKLLLVAPNQLATEYGDVLQNGEKSKYYKQFDSKSDKLAPQVGAAYKATEISQLPATASLHFTQQAGEDGPIAMATNDSGAIVSVSVNETSTVKPVEAGATVSTSSANVQAITGVTDSTKGFQTTYGYQLLFYVPPAESKQKIEMLGFTQSLLSAKEL